MKKIQFISLMKSLDQFLQNGRKRNLGDVVLTLQKPTASDGEVGEWIDTYKLTLSAKNVDKYLQTSLLSSDERLPTAERIWKVDFDRFKNFRYGAK